MTLDPDGTVSFGRIGDAVLALQRAGAGGKTCISLPPAYSRIPGVLERE